MKRSRGWESKLPKTNPDSSYIPVVFRGAEDSLAHAEPACGVNGVCQVDDQKRCQFADPSFLLQQPADAYSSNSLVILFDPAAHKTGFVLGWGRVENNSSCSHWWIVRRCGTGRCHIRLAFALTRLSGFLLRWWGWCFVRPAFACPFVAGGHVVVVTVLMWLMWLRSLPPHMCVLGECRLEDQCW
ncbi:hypothetical protein BGX38DRAFT_210981 [Terfezia claveryi]|nr:hypothetical protein BGX38DRAFT_210981 [Terfezia claveryi]